MNSEQLAAQVKVAALAVDDALGSDVDVFYVGEILGIADWFICATGNNPRQVKAIVEKVEEELTTSDKVKPISIEGKASAEWVLMDYGDFIVHVFSEEARQFYNLSSLWSDVDRMEIAEIA